MSKLLKVMVFILLVLGSIALTFACMLFAKREVMIGRTRKLERTIIALGSTIEKEAAVVENTPRYPAKDVSEVTSEELDAPQLSPFWDTYSADLELQDGAVMEISKKKQLLMNYYKIDPATLKPARDLQKMKITTGEGTMQSVLDDLLGKSSEQLDRLNATRQQLEDIRKELVATITELNDLKRAHRTSLSEIVDLKANIVRLEGELRDEKQKVEELEEEKRALEDTIAEQRRTISTHEETIEENTLQIAALKEDIKKYEELINKAPVAGGEGDAAANAVSKEFTGQIEPGKKGEVITVNSEWNFVIVQLSDKFFAEITADPEAGIPQVTLMIKRMGTEELFVTKAKLIQVKKAEKLGIFDMLPDWQQMPAAKGDVVFY
ncbi:MAG: hypothetical protein KAI74_03960 [Kiritimatiellae bacterium]|nr:hypothetical protein [Kiritimatiellia bacterium]